MNINEIADTLELYTVGRPKGMFVHITTEELQKLIDELRKVEQPSDSQIQKEKSLAFLEGCIAGTEASNKFNSDTPTRNKPKEDITENEVRINMLELAFNQAKEHAESITVLTDDYRLIFKAEKRGNEDGFN